MNGKFFKLTYQSMIKIIQAEKTFEGYIVSVSKAFALPSCVIRELTGSFTDKDGDSILINTEMDYSILLDVMEKENIRTLKIHLSKENSQDNYTQSSQFEVIPSVSQDMNIQTDDVISKHVQIQTEKAQSPEVKEQTCQTNNCRKNEKDCQKKHGDHEGQRYQQGTLQYEKHKARKEVKRMFREEFKKVKKNMLKILFDKSDAEVEKRFKKQNKDQKVDNKVESNQCKGCNMILITGIKYKCSQCKDYYFCEECEEKYSLSHGHCFIKFRPNVSQKEIKLGEKMQNQLDLYLNKVIDYKDYIQERIKFGNPMKYFNDLFNQFSLKSYQTSCTNKTLNIYSKNNKFYQKVTLNLKNQGNISWPSPCFLSCNLNNSSVVGEDVKISREVKPNETIAISISLNLTQIKRDGCFISIWQLEDGTREKFGSVFVLRVHCSYDNVLAYCEPAQEEKFGEFTFISTNNLIQSYESFSMAIKPDYNKLTEEMRNEYGLQDDKYAIMNALMFAKGNKQAAYQTLKSKRNNICYYHKIK